MLKLPKSVSHVATVMHNSLYNWTQIQTQKSKTMHDMVKAKGMYRIYC